MTDARMSRYFMTIPEAVQLVIRSGSLSQGSGGEASGRVYVLEMGDPVKDRRPRPETDSGRLSGLEPEKDIAIEIVGARPGEKLHEDLFNPHERPQATPAQKIVRAEHDQLDPAWVENTFAEINLLVLEGDAAAPSPIQVADALRGHGRTPRQLQVLAPGPPRETAAAKPWRIFLSLSQSITSSVPLAQTPDSRRSSGSRSSSSCTSPKRAKRRRRSGTAPTSAEQHSAALEARIAQLARSSQRARRALRPQPPPPVR